MNRVAARAAATILRYSMATPDCRLGVAVSGGGDSVALLHLLREIAPAAQLHVLHFNHKLRGEESDRDAEFVARLAAKLALPFHPGCWERPARSNREAAAREARLRFFAGAKAALGLDRIATGHTRSDQAETVLLRVIRGSGTAGLSGIRPVTAEGIIRPLIEVSREELREWLRQRGLEWREDATNRDVRHADRNRVRLELLPRLQAEWNPAVEEALAHLAAIAFDEETCREQELATRLPGAVLDVTKVGKLPVALQRRFIRAAAGERTLTFPQTEEVRRLILSERGSGRVSLPCGGRAERSFGQVRFVSQPGTAPPEPIRFRVPGEAWGVRLERKVGPGVYNTCSYLDSKKIPREVEMRGWRPGDRYRPVGSAHERKLKDLFQEARIPSWDRHFWPILTGEGKVLWARRFGAAAEVAAEPDCAEAVLVWDEIGQS